VPASSLALSCCLVIVFIGHFFPSGMTYPDDPLTWRVVSAVHHRQAVTNSTCDVATGPDHRPDGSTL
jgi:hypothetical protein